MKNLPLDRIFPNRTFTILYNDIIDKAFHKNSGLTLTAVNVLIQVIRKTIGFQKSQDFISGSQLVEASGYDYRSILKALKLLETQGFISILRRGKSSGRINNIRLNSQAFITYQHSKQDVTSKPHQTYQHSKQDVTSKPLQDVTSKPHTKESKYIKERPVISEQNAKLLYESRKAFNGSLTDITHISSIISDFKQN